MSKGHAGYDGWPVEGPGMKEWLVHVYLREFGDTVRASAALTVGHFRVEGEGISDSEDVGVDEARQLAAGDALLDVARTLIRSHGDRPLRAKAH